MIGSRQITTIKLWDAEALAQNTNKSSALIDLREIVGNYTFSLHHILAGAGTVKFE